jgi:hypothetical protein
MADILKIPLLSTEIAALWSSYMGDSMITSVLKYFLNRVELVKLILYYNKLQNFTISGLINPHKQ